MATRRVNLILRAEVHPPFKRVWMPDRALQPIGCVHPEAVSTRRLGSPADVQQCVACGGEWSQRRRYAFVDPSESGCFIPSAGNPDRHRALLGEVARQAGNRLEGVAEYASGIRIAQRVEYAPRSDPAE